MDDHPHIAFLFSAYPAVPPALCDAEMQALETDGLRLTVASLSVPDDCLQLARPASLKAEILYPPPPALSKMLRLSPPQDESWRAMSQLSTVHGREYSVSILPRGLERVAWLCARELRRRGVQHVHVRSPGALPAALYLKKAGLPFSFTVESLLGSTEPGYDDFLRELMQQAEFVIAAGDALRTLLAAKAPDSADKIHRIHQGIDASRYHAALCGDAGTLRLISTAAPGHDPGLVPLLEAMAQLGDSGVDTELVVAGDGPWRPALEQRTARLSLTGRVRFILSPDHEETKRLLAASDVFLYLDPSSGPAVPPRIMEAMATGLPVVALAQPGAAELIADSLTGWLVPAGAASLTDRLALLAADPALRSTAGHAGLERMQEAFSLSRTAKPLADLFRKSIAGRFAPSMSQEASGVLCLLESWPPDPADTVLAAELRFLREQAGVDLFAADAVSTDAPPPESMEFLPDGAVIEAVWHQERQLSRRAAALRNLCPHTPGEDFFRAARRAVYLASLRRSRGWTHVHALRAPAALWAWLLQRLTDLTASVTIEPSVDRAPQPLTDFIDGFAFGSLSDPRLPSDFPNLLHSAPASAPRRLMGLLSPAPKPSIRPDAASIWTKWLAQLRSPGLRSEA